MKFSFAQSPSVIDTTDLPFRESIKDFYQNQALQTAEFFKSVSDTAVRKELEAVAAENQKYFLEKISNGDFVCQARYDFWTDRIFERIQKANPQIRPVKFLAEIDDKPNAYNNGDGIISVQLPFFSAMENEAQLAVVLCHEIAHQELQHTRKAALAFAQTAHSEKITTEARKIKKKKYNKASQAKRLYQNLLFADREKSRRAEMQADSLGFAFFSRAYPKQAGQAIRMLELLDEIDREKDSLTEPDYAALFGSAQQPFKKEWIQNDELSRYHYDKAPQFWQIDSLKTHPDCPARIERLKATFGVKLEGSTAEDPQYRKFSADSQYDLILGLYYKKEYGKSLYRTLLLLKSDKGNVFLKQMVCDNLKRLQSAQQNYTLNNCLETIRPAFSDSYNRFLYFVRKLRKSELTTIIEQYQTKT